LLLVDAERDGEQRTPVELVTLPAEIVAGSYTWAADGKWVAFLTQATTGNGGAGFLALCAVDTAAGGWLARLLEQLLPQTLVSESQRFRVLPRGE
jgi:hypothetical protein